MRSLKLILTLTCLIALLSCKKEKSRICELYSKKTGYAIGTIKSYKSSPFKVVYKYDYTANGVEFKGNEKTYGIGQKDELLVDKKYVVIYEIENPSNSDLNMNFFIETDTDFMEFKNNYYSTPPSPDFPNNCK